ncbi:conjugal transfer protein TraN [Hydromonas duriensis]|uniref:Conjugal transfer mating pair stabilization protein TraN n=1 Tax=Hydromonas duriensis TaxID=1527608 RepID=A0A4R6Y236_9BURK|nr:conjugal transfer protein TraN [Hydromonas duriensis]TDR30296.1 conjugal transfer mating pair stabilization protein TraN [Hydromonas duriensis]
MSLWKRLTHGFVLFTLLVNLTSPLTAMAAECKRTGSVCTQGAQTRNINGINVYKDCWAWQDTYQCTTTGGTSSCAPLSGTSGCGQNSSTCLETSLITGECIRYSKQYSCDKDIKLANGGNLPAGITEQAPTHEITSHFDESACEASKSQLSGCALQTTTCTAGFATKTINGVEVSFPCWENEEAYQCLSKQPNTTCDDTELNDKCTFKTSQCINWVNGECQTGENIYTCKTREGTSSASDSCKDKDFANVMAGMEGAREFAKYFDESSLEFFKGDDSRCTVKLGGALGGDCCKAKGDSHAWRDAAIQYAAEYALGELASGYTFTVLTTSASTTMAGLVGSTVTTASVSTYGVGTAVGANGSMALTFNPVLFAAAVAIYFIMQFLACDMEDKKTVLKKQAGLCVSVGSFCSNKIVGACIEKTQTYCCFVSKLARIINQQGKAQLGMDYGKDPEHPTCNGFKPEDLEKIDFGQMDLTEFANDIEFTLPDFSKLTNDAQNKADQQLNQLNQPSAPATQGTYYDTP